MLFRSIVIFLFMSLSGLAQAATLLVWGDSLSSGYQLRAEQAWPVLLQTRLEEKGFPHAVVNGSVSGETSDGGRSRLPAALEEHEPNLLILALGSNDGLQGRLATLAANLDAMIAAAHDAGARVLLVGMEMPPNYGPQHTRRFREIFRDAAEQNDVPLIPFLLEGFAEDRGYFLDDNIHPNAEAQQRILDTVWEKLEPMLQEDVAKPGNDETEHGNGADR